MKARNTTGLFSLVKSEKTAKNEKNYKWKTNGTNEKKSV